MDDDLDGLTGCKNRDRLWFQIGHDLRNSDTSRYQESFLCCDLDHLIDHLDVHGHHGGDAVIIDLAKRLADPSHDVYRFGGDEFVVQGQSSPIDGLCDDLVVPVRQCVVHVDLPIVQRRSIRATSWVMAHLQMALVQPKLINAAIRCVAPAEWAG
jgi:diguanylate cyclase (GGDEF)-like protein